ncbi:unnamed protein product [Pylaiella littoralis]
MDAAATDDGVPLRRDHAPAFEENREDEVANLIEISRKLCLVEDPDEEPFRSKYKAREALKKARQILVILHREGSGDGRGVGVTAAAAAAAGRVALIDYRLGVIALAVEEHSAAQEALDKCSEAFFEGAVVKIAEAAGNEEDSDDDQENGKTLDSPDPPPIPTEAPPGMVRPCPLAWDHPEEAADTLTQLGLLWSARGYARRSILYFLAAVGFLRQASSLACAPPSSSSSSSSSTLSNGEAENRHGGRGEREGDERKEAGIPVDVEVGGGGGGGGGGGDSAAVAAVETGKGSAGGEKQEQLQKKAKLESMLTHAFYYLAQAYGVRDVQQSAKYCALTLQARCRQLDASQRGDGVKVSFDPGDWSRNACFLADYFSSLGRFSEAGRCLLAAQTVLEPRGAKSGAGMAGANVAPPPPENPAAAAAAAVATAVNGNSPPSICPPRPPLPKAEEKGREAEGKAKQGAEQQEKEEQEEDGKGEEGAPESGNNAEEKRENNNEHRSGDDDDAGEETETETETETEEDRERRREQRADVDRHMAKLYISVLQVKHQEQSRGGGGGTFSKTQGRNIKDAEGHDALGLGGFASLGIGELPLCDPAVVPDDFESVRDVFKKAKSHTERALRHYVLDGFVTAHVSLQQGLSSAYSHLSSFERDTKRRQAMCARRAQALEPLLAALAPKAYERFHKELSFELGEIYQDLADVKVTRVEEKLSTGIARSPSALASDLRATNKLLKARSPCFFSHFVAMYHEGAPGASAADSSSQPAKGMEAAEAVGYLQARFMRARLNGKLQPLTSESELRALRMSCAEFTWLSEHAREHLKAVRKTAGDAGIFEQELELAEEMAQLQRRNIANLERKLEEQKQAYKQKQ